MHGEGIWFCLLKGGCGVCRVGKAVFLEAVVECIFGLKTVLFA